MSASTEIKPKDVATATSATLSGLKELLWKVFELEESVRFGGGPEQQEQMEIRLQDMLTQIKNISQNSWAFQDLKVPVNMLRYMDDGGIPDSYTAETFKAALADNQASKGKVQAINHLREDLLEQLEKHMPSETEDYRTMLQSQKSSTTS
ncbi:hypothetical protein CEUSTIGMA_g11569.t1 [Chlamydomonas eustigma]|uniref:Mediator of RNA polymerase II transcription subunit 10 n=1 Tax=Chlamydomonas eustigma TaxID=1157962 RepID=A0A250XM98_9CHLO|nr:hypothetical protein CEUSTIGMA_g11569.t1 [Chlamydomonas eustigma]|eukprot:GAX84146.1 hypothetical protein CEUSTIGMA_g11569.t1 [Chlamydomonas eustigma]